MLDLTAEAAKIFRITHIDNVPWILQNGLHSSSSTCIDPNFRAIGNVDLIAKRATVRITVPPRGSLCDYIPFYFTPHSPMLLNIKTGRSVPQVPMSEIAILTSTLHRVHQQGIRFVFTDRHAYVVNRMFSNDLDGLANIDWRILRKRDFKRDPDDPGKLERYMAEALIHGHLPITAVECVACQLLAQEAQLKAVANSLRVPISIITRPDWYF